MSNHLYDAMLDASEGRCTFDNNISFSETVFLFFSVHNFAGVFSRVQFGHFEYFEGADPHDIFILVEFDLIPHNLFFLLVPLDRGLVGVEGAGQDQLVAGEAGEAFGQLLCEMIVGRGF